MAVTTGLNPDDIDIEEPVYEVEVWESNWEAVEVFTACLSQFVLVIGMSAARYTGLPTPAIESVMRMKGVPTEDQWEMLSLIQSMERAALKEMNPNG